MTLSELIKAKRQEILQLAAQHGARNVRVFGSVARGEERNDSDLDLLIDMGEGRSLLDRVGLWQDLEELLGHKVHVVNAKSVHWYIRDHVLKEAIPL